jgi:hypothetical protein
MGLAENALKKYEPRLFHGAGIIHETLSLALLLRVYLPAGATCAAFLYNFVEKKK